MTSARELPRPVVGGGWLERCAATLYAVRAPLACVTIFVAAIALQQFVGAYESERGSYSDEATHLLNGLLLRDYLREGLFQDPVEYARAYYVNYPKIAPGMWPPLFHGVLGLLLLLGGPPHATALLLVGAAAAWAAFRLWLIADRLVGASVATILAALFLVIPAVIDMSSAVMLDVVIAALTLEATYHLATYFASGRNADAVRFGVLASACCLTKGNGLAILLAPPLLALLTRRFRMLLRPGLYISALIVLVSAFPAVWYSYRLDASIGDFGPVTASIVEGRLRFYTAHVTQQFGLFTMLPLLGGVLFSLTRPRGDSDLDSILPAAMTALVVAASLFHLLNPHIVVASRYVTLVYAPMLGLAGLGAGGMARRAGGSRRHRILRGTVLGLVVSGTLLNRPPTVIRSPQGWREAAAMLDTAGQLAGQRILVISNETGEGAFVAEVAVTGRAPRATVIRGSKLLAEDDWMGNNLQLKFTSAAALMQELEALHVRYIVADGSRGALALRYRGLVSELLSRDNPRLVPLQAATGVSGVVVYRLTHQAPGPPKKLQITVTGLRGNIIER